MNISISHCHFTCVPVFGKIDRNLKTASVTVLKSTEHDITLTSFVADLSYPGLSNFNIMCEIDAIEGAGSLALIFAFV